MGLPACAAWWTRSKIIRSLTIPAGRMDRTQRSFSHLLHLTAHHWRLAVNRRLKHQGMSQASCMAIAVIARQQEPLSQRELASELGVETASLVPLVNRLVAQGLLARELTARDILTRLLCEVQKQ